MFERFTDRARRVLTLAQEEARLLSHSFIGTEHMLLGMIHEGEGVAAKVLEDLGVSLTAARGEVEAIVGRAGRAPAGSPPFTPRAKKVLELSLREALQLGHHYIGTEHLLLGLVREGEGVGVQVLVALGADPDRVRRNVFRVMTGTQSEPEVRIEARGRRRAFLSGAARRVRMGTYAPAAGSEKWRVAADRCSLCGRDVWEVEHFIEAGEVRVCDECIGAAATVLASAGTDRRSLALPARVFGDVPDAGSVGQLVAAVDALVGPVEARRRRADLVEDAASLEARLRALDEILLEGARVSRIRFLTPDSAELRFHFRVAADDEELTAQGVAVRRAGSWMLTRAVLVEVLESAGVRAPRPRD